MTIGERFKSVRMIVSDAKGIKYTQEDFARILGITRVTLTNIEIGRSEPTLPVKKLLCQNFNISFDWLETGEGEMFNELDRNKHIIDMLTEALEVNDDPTPAQAFKKKLIEAIADLSPEAWEKLADIAEELKKGQKKEQA